VSNSIPADAFDRYLAMGAERSYALLAEELGVSKQAVTKRAKTERWQERIDGIESEARERTDKKAVETIEQLNDRWLKMWSVVERRALEGLRNTPMATAMDCVRSLDLAHKNTRLIRGEPTERTSIEEVVKREHARWLRPVADEDSDEPPKDEPSTPSEATDAANGA
jgi:hypothetical protein